LRATPPKSMFIDITRWWPGLVQLFESIAAEVKS
jgi:hypothetical protein